MTVPDEKPTILVIDDEPAVRGVLDALLAYEGYRSYQAANGEQGLALASRLLPDVILLDVMMPDMDGYQVCRQLRADPLLREVPILMITALSAREAKIEGLSAGADDFINKPIDSMELRTRLRTITRLNRYRRLLNEQRRFSWIVERARDGYVILNPQGALLFANPQAQLYLGHIGDAFSAGESLVSLASRQYRFEPETAWQGWPGETAPNQPRYLVRPETHTAPAFWLQVEKLELELGAESQIVCRLRDVTAEKALQTSSATFSAFVSHKLRTPLSSIISSLDIICMSIAHQDYHNLPELCDYALQGAKRLNGTVSDVLNYLYTTSESSSGGSCALSRLRELVAQLRAELESGSVELELPAAAEDQLLPLSATAVEMLLREILENSCKFHPRRAPRLQISAELQEEGVRLRFCDDGIHLAPQQLAQAWSPYQQGEKYFTGEVAGMGLGLSVVANLIWSVGGKTRIYNRGDRPGIIVEVDLPLLPESATPDVFA